MTFLRILLISIISFFYISGFAVCATASSNDSTTSFKKLIGDSEWKVNLWSFSLSQKKEGNTFELNMGAQKYFGFSAFQGKDEMKNQFGPFRTEYKDSLRELLDYAMVFSGQEKSGQFAMHINWRLYHQSIKKWAKIWQNSSLRKEWDKTEKQTRYKNLTNMISEFLKEDMQSVANAIGFELTGADMEKMAYDPAGKLKFSDMVLKEAGIPENMKIAIPLVSNLLLKPLPDSIAVKDAQSDPKDKIQVDSLFVTAEKKSTNVYCTFNRVFDEYEITGDTLEKDRTYTRLLPISNPEYQDIACNLFQACLKATHAEKRKTLFLRMNLKQYPKVYRQVIEHFNFSSMPASVIKRAGFSDTKFYEYKPEINSGLKALVNPFLEKNGYVFSSFEMSLESRRKAKKYSNFEKTLKPLGVKSDDKPFVPDIVYMKIESKK